MAKRFFGWSDLVITKNFISLVAQLLLVVACGCAGSLFYFQDVSSVFKAFRLKVFKCPNKDSNFFEQQLCLLNSFQSKSNNLATLKMGSL